jgi:iron(III) transport system ATP-binding protein
MSELVVRALRKGFGGTPVLRGVDLTVPEGTLAAVLGPSGCGKTTLLRVVAGFEPADAGQVLVGGREVCGPGRQLPPERRRIGVVPQEGALFPHLSAAANVAFGLPRGRGRDARAAEMLELVGLAGFGARMPHELSGGQQQRVALARALAPEPALVLLDEPFSALDTALRAAVREDVRRALEATGATAVLVTHDQQEALSVADLVAVLRDGRIVQAAAPAELYAAPGDLDVATFVGDAVMLDAVARAGTAGSRADCALGSLRVRAVSANGNGAGDGPGSIAGTVVIRPEQILVGPPEHGVRARVTGLVFYGHDSLIRLAVPSAAGTAVQVAARVQSTHLPVADSEVGLTVTGDVSFYPRPRPAVPRA